MAQFLALAAAALLISQPLAHASPVPFFVGHGPVQPFRCFEDDHGGFYLVWIGAQEQQAFTLLSQHLDPEGRPLWAGPGLVISSRVTSSEDWSGLADGQGGLTLFWDEADGVRAQRFLPDGSRRRSGNSVLLSTAAAIQPDAVPDALGGTLAVWRHALGGGRTVILAQRIDQDGKPLWMKGGLRVSLRASHQTNPRVVYDNMSGMIIAWRDQANNASELRVQRIDFQGNRLWTLEGLSVTAPVGAEEFPAIAPVGTGSAVISWAESVDQTNQIRLQKVGPEAELKWRTPVYASDGPVTYNRWNPLVLGDDTGGVWVAWEDFRNQLNYQIEINHLTAGGISAWTAGETAAAPSPGDQGKAAMIGNGNNGVWLAWIDNRLATIGMYMQGMDGSGARLLEDSGRLIADHLSKPSPPRLAHLGPGKAVVVWADRPSRGQWTLSWSIVVTP